MDAARLATELTNARFGTTQFRQGYDMADVDRFIDGVVAALRGEAPASGLAARVRAVRFATTSLQRGYDMADVDTLLESVVASLEAGAAPVGGAAPRADAPRAGTAPTSAPELSAMPDGAAASRPGVLARLLAAVRGDQPLR